MPKVYVPNKSYHDFSDAARFGQLIFVTDGLVKSRLNINSIYRDCSEAMKDAEAGDYVLVSSLSILVAAMASLMAFRFSSVNYLMWNGEKYIARSVHLAVGGGDSLTVPNSSGQTIPQNGEGDHEEDHSGGK